MDATEVEIESADEKEESPGEESESSDEEEESSDEEEESSDEEEESSVDSGAEQIVDFESASLDVNGDEEVVDLETSEDGIADLETSMASEGSTEDFDSLFSLPDDEIELRDPQEIEDASAEATYRHRGKADSYNGFKVNGHEKKRSSNHRDAKGRSSGRKVKTNHKKPIHQAHGPKNLKKTKGHSDHGGPTWGGPPNGCDHDEPDCT